ncbi:MFS transporter [Paraburkholderia acidipaludis]|uniref:MFS transporter n=1 Tax=Paraburkholderia acidipaludis TaxID=660537 RepID=UPI0004880521|nr:MFS transporter [Paraburkholderia acidipaludis]
MERSDGRSKLVLLLLFLTWGTVFLDRMSQLYLAPYMIGDLHLDSTKVGNLAAITGICWAISTLLLGALSDRIGRRKVLLPSIFAFSLLSWLSGVVQSYEQMLLVRGLLGIAEGPCFSVIMALTEETAEPQHRGRNVGIVVSAASLIGLAVAPVLTTQVAAHAGWRTAFFVAGVPGIMLGLLIWKFVPEPERKTRIEKEHLTLGDYLSILTYRNMWLCCFGAIGVICWLFEVNVFAPLYITQVAGQSGTTAGFLLGAAGLGAFLLGILFPTLSDRIGRKAALLIMSVLIALLVLAMLTQSLYANLWLLAGIFFLTNAQQGIVALLMVLVPTETVPARLGATAIGMATMAAEIVGATAAPAIGGALAQQFGLSVPLYMALGGAAVVFLVGLLMKETARRTSGAHEAGSSMA